MLEFHSSQGPVAQLVAHLVRNEGVRGSNPLRSTARQSPHRDDPVGAFSCRAAVKDSNYAGSAEDQRCLPGFRSAFRVGFEGMCVWISMGTARCGGRHSPAFVQAVNRRCAVAGETPNVGGTCRHAHPSARTYTAEVNNARSSSGKSHWLPRGTAVPDAISREIRSLAGRLRAGRCAQLHGLAWAQGGCVTSGRGAGRTPGCRRPSRPGCATGRGRGRRRGWCRRTSPLWGVRRGPGRGCRPGWAGCG